MISTTVIMIIITIAICVSQLCFVFFPRSPDEILPQGLHAFAVLKMQRLI